MGAEGLDCTWCGSARSIEYGICQVCLMEYPLETQVIPLPHKKSSSRERLALQSKASLVPQKPLVSSRKASLDHRNALPRRIIDLVDKTSIEVAE